MNLSKPQQCWGQLLPYNCQRLHVMANTEGCRWYYIACMESGRKTRCRVEHQRDYHSRGKTFVRPTPDNTLHPDARERCAFSRPRGTRR